MKLSVQLGRKGSVLCFGQSIYDATKKVKRRTALRVPPLEPAIGAEGSIGEVELSFCESVGRKLADSIRGTCLFAGSKVFTLSVHALVVVDILQDQYQLQVTLSVSRVFKGRGELTFCQHCVYRRSQFSNHQLVNNSHVHLEQQIALMESSRTCLVWFW